MLGKGKKTEEDAPESPQEDSRAAPSRYPPEDVEEMIKLKGFNTLQEMVSHFLNTMMERYYQKKEASKWQ